MGWFTEQLKQRKQNDAEVFAESFVDLAGSVMGKKVHAAMNDERAVAKNEIDLILKYYHIHPAEVPETITDMNDRLDFLLRPHGIMHRTVKLEKGWYRNAVGAMLGVRKADGQIVALLPWGAKGYCYTDGNGNRVKVGRKSEGLFKDEALAFYKPFPLRKMDMGDLVRYMLETVSRADLAATVAAAIAATGIGLLMPKINNLIFSGIIHSGSMQLLLSVSIFLLCATVSTVLVNTIQAILMRRINTKIGVTVQSAAMMRVLSLPASFFKDHSAGELTQRTQYVEALCTMLMKTILSTGLTSVFSLVYLGQVFEYAPSLVVPALTVTLATVLFSVISSLVQMKISRRMMEFSAKENGMTFALISGIQKIRLSGAEKRAFARWGKLYAKAAELKYDPPMFLKINTAVTTAISLIGTIVLYYIAVRTRVAVADYYSFNVAYGMVSGAFLSLARVSLSLAEIKPCVDMVKPLFDAVPEASDGKEAVTGISGGIELNNVSFRYHEHMPLILDDVSLKIQPGQYVAVVGKTGCGKSTLMRLLLGFEQPQTGTVYYDGKDIRSLDLKSLRKKIGIVMQNGKLFQGDIYSNIVIAAPTLTLSDAWEAAELAGMADDIRRMPMGMFTVVSEGGGGISGGQKQRLMIARAVAPKPKVLMFDEATSALDNITQKKVSEALDRLKCTRIVIAHRLSTIKQCDRILVLDKGKIIEDGKYDELIAKNGFFAELVARQRVDIAQE